MSLSGSFYSAFTASDDYGVYHGSSLIGLLPASDLPNLDDCFLLAGRRWRVVAIEDERRVVVVRPAKGSKPPMFTSGGGEVHPRVRDAMRLALLDDRPCGYLNSTGARLLAEARLTAREAGIDRRRLVPLSPSSCLWFTWTGTKAQRTLCLIADAAGLAPADHKIAVELSASAADSARRLAGVDALSLDPARPAARLPSKQTRKLDEHLDEGLLIEALAVDALDLETARGLLMGLRAAVG
ncbi:hypothetical protein Pla175_19840 [Pirellulimonas nuda]|uniref:ATP-dependent helicase Lhr n=1 Tax=Pirellulimonas nuda TaxID=2528009 RepID=A0A518DAU3_9BACT|nr:hypothetical protein [Pirellulimonas nuda]QDU88604.1 hypothetical protein Pla175_19840 [Pirellulimonas nuda]